METARPADTASPRTWLGWAPILAVVVIGVSASVAGFILARNVELERAASEIRIRADWRASDFERKLRNTTDSLQSVAKYVSGRPELTAEGFQSIARAAYGEVSFSTAFFWAPWVAGEDRARFVAEARRISRPDFDILARGANGLLESSPTKPAYMPELFEVAYGDAPDALGFDMLSNSLRGSYVNKARDFGQPIASPLFPLDVERQHNLGFIIIWPIYRTEMIPETVAQRRATFRGAVMARFRLDRFLQGIVRGTPAITEILDVAIGATDLAPLHAARYDPDKYGFVIGSDLPPVPEARMAVERNFTLYSQVWKFTSYFKPQENSWVQAAAPLLWLGTGLLLTVMLSLVTFRQVFRIERAESGLMAQGNRLRAVMDNTVDGLITISDRGVVTDFSRRAEEIFGYSKEEVIGHNVSMLMPEPDRSRHDQYLRNYQQTGDPKIIGIGREVTGRRRDGSLFPLDLAVGEIPGPGNSREYVGTVRDISDRKRVEEALRIEERRFRQAFEESPFGMVLARAEDFRLVRVNQAFARMLGYQPDELVGRSRDEVSRVDYKNFPPMPEEDLGVAWHPQEKIYIHRDGHEVRARIRLMRLAASPGAPDLLLGIAEDITQQRDIEEQLRQAQKMESIGQLTGGMAHDFNNLLAIIIGNLDAVRPALIDESEEGRMLDEALDAALRGAELTRSLLAFARRQPLQPSVIHVEDKLGQLVKLLGRILGQNIEVDLDIGAGLWPILVDPSQLEAAVVNLATNARDAMPRGGKLRVAASNHGGENGEYVRIDVSDNGIGMGPEVAERIFEPFFTTKGPGHGTGLGLSMVYGFIKQSGGDITVQSHPGQGTTFSLFLPRALRGAVTQNAPNAVSVERGDGERILVVEDNDVLRGVVLRQLNDLGYYPLEAGSAEKALAMLEREPVSLLFTDVILSGAMDGYELAEKAAAKYPGLKILLTSGFTGTEPPASVARIPLLTKPYRKDELARRIDMLLHPRNG